MKIKEFREWAIAKGFICPLVEGGDMTTYYYLSPTGIIVKLFCNEDDDIVSITGWETPVEEQQF